MLKTCNYNCNCICNKYAFIVHIYKVSFNSYVQRHAELLLLCRYLDYPTLLSLTDEDSCMIWSRNFHGLLVYNYLLRDTDQLTFTCAIDFFACEYCTMVTFDSYM